MRVALGRLLRDGMALLVARGVYALGRAAGAIHLKARGWGETEGRVRPWAGRWVTVLVDHLGRTDRRQVQARERALRLTGFAASPAGAWVRLDNLVTDLESLASDVACDGRWSYSQVTAATQRASVHLATLGVGRGDRVAIMAYNTPEFVVAMFAVWRAGAVLVPVNHKLSPGEVAYIAGQSGAALLLASGDLLATARAGRPGLRVIALDGPDSEDRFAPLPSDAAYDEVPTMRVHEDAPAQILYTWGTTGSRRAASTPTAPSATPR